ncbi:aquaporin, partial [Candidatus Saccharibacteria bacterium]|nr:aquaporin [Candidatus Saccharibacteria bacterium]
AAELFKAEAITEGKEWYAFFAEMLGAGIFGFAVASALREKKERMAAAFTVGGGLFLGLIISGSAAILNPAVAVALQAINWDTWPLAVYFFAPLVGAAAGFIVYQVLLDDVNQVHKLLKRRK